MAKTVLIVDDDATVVDLIKNILGLLGLEARVTRNGRDALAAVRDSRPDAIILDLMMPVMDGFMTLSQLRREKNGKDLPVIVLSALGDQKATLDRLPGIVGAMTKGKFSLMELREMLGKAGVLEVAPPAPEVPKPATGPLVTPPTHSTEPAKSPAGAPPSSGLLKGRAEPPTKPILKPVPADSPKPASPPEPTSTSDGSKTAAATPSPATPAEPPKAPEIAKAPAEPSKVAASTLSPAQSAEPAKVAAPVEQVQPTNPPTESAKAVSEASKPTNAAPLPAQPAEPSKIPEPAEQAQSANPPSDGASVPATEPETEAAKTPAVPEANAPKPDSAVIL